MKSAPNVAVDLFEHGALIWRILTELRPARVAYVCPGERFQTRLAEYAAALGFELTSDPAEAELVISGASDYASVRGLLESLDPPAVTVVVGGTAWPCGRRDALGETAELPAPERARYAFLMPVPGQLALSSLPSPVAFAIADGGPRNGVRTAVEDVCRGAAEAWDVRLLQGFGGVAVLIPSALASPECWATIAPPDDDSTLSRLELANVQLRLAAAELDEHLARERARTHASERALVAEQAARAELARWVGEQRAATERLGEVIERLVQELPGVNQERERLWRLHREELDRVAAAYEQERAFVALQVNRIAESGAWRWGHRFAILRARVLFRRHRGTDAVSRLLERVSRPPPSSSLLPTAQSGAGGALEPAQVRGQPSTGP
jgi:hypothetical protein